MKQPKNDKKNTNKNKNYLDISNSKGYFKESQSIAKKNLFSSNTLDNLIKGLSKPKFLGSIHLKKEFNSKFSSVDQLLNNEHNLKLTRSLKNAIFNPITKILIVAAIIFNLLWFLLIYFF